MDATGVGADRADAFKMRMVSIDYSMESPAAGLDVETSAFMGSRYLERVPVVRLFGRHIPSGRKTLLHLHRAFPYLYVAMPKDWPLEGELLARNVRQLAGSIEEALIQWDTTRQREEARAAQGGGGGGEGPGDGGEFVRDSWRTRQRVLKAQAVRGVPIYGCHLQEVALVKIVLLDPGDVLKAAGLLMGGSVMGAVFQCFNAHIPYLAQVASYIPPRARGVPRL